MNTTRPDATGLPRDFYGLPGLVRCLVELLVIFGLSSFLLSCGSPSDLRLYLAASLRAGDDLPGALDTCLVIRAPDTRGQCFVDLLRETGSAGSTGVLCAATERECPRLSQGLWKWECYFIGAEDCMEAGKVKKAAQLCAMAGGLKNDCAQHLWQGEVRRLIHDAGSAGFSERLPRAQALYSQWDDLLGETSDLSDRFWLRFFQNGFEPEPSLRIEACDSLPGSFPKRCREAAARLYEARLRDVVVTPGGRQLLCGLDELKVEYLTGLLDGMGKDLSAQAAAWREAGRAGRTPPGAGDDSPVTGDEPSLGPSRPPGHMGSPARQDGLKFGLRSPFKLRASPDPVLDIVLQEQYRWVCLLDRRDPSPPILIPGSPGDQPEIGQQKQSPTTSGRLP